MAGSSNPGQVGLHSDWKVFSSPAEIAQALAERVAEELRRAVEARGRALLALSGGRTPELFLQRFSEQELPWEAVTVTLVDERFVPTGSERSNERLVRENLLQGPASSPPFFGLWSDAESVEIAAAAAADRLAALPLPLDVAVLGMGLDGHTASFFPDADNLPALLDPGSDALVLPVNAPSAGEPRLTLALARLVESRFTALHIEGTPKREVLERALSGREERALPVEAIFRHAKNSPVEIYWAPTEDEVQ